MTPRERLRARVAPPLGGLLRILREGPNPVPFARLAVSRRRGPAPSPSAPSFPVEAEVTPPDTGRARRGDLGLTVFSIIRNGITNGYPFVEAYGSWLDTADRIVIVDGFSGDGTREALAELARIVDRVEVIDRPWPNGVSGGSAIAELTNAALELARPGSDRLMYVQSDEVYTAPQRDLVRGIRTVALEFAGCVNFWNSFEMVLTNDFPMRYLRSFPAAAAAASVADGFTFRLDDTPVERTDEMILHYGWCFPVNILQKHVSHGRLYRDDRLYRMRGRLAQLMIDRGSTDRHLLDALAPAYRTRPFSGEHPQCMRHLLGLTAYDPRPGLDLLRRGVRW